MCQLSVIIGNVRGARHMLPESDWKAEDQRGAQARTSLGNNQGSDISSLIFKEESNREETKKGDSEKKPSLFRRRK